MFKQARLTVYFTVISLDNKAQQSHDTGDRSDAIDLIGLYCSDLATVGIHSKHGYMVFADMSAVCPMKEHNGNRYQRQSRPASLAVLNHRAEMLKYLLVVW